jgi:starvation-inducible outer membrane lipoprotein
MRLQSVFIKMYFAQIAKICPLCLASTTHFIIFRSCWGRFQTPFSGRICHHSPQNFGERYPTFYNILNASLAADDRSKQVTLSRPLCQGDQMCLWRFAQVVTQPIIWQKWYITFIVDNCTLRTWATYVIKKSPITQKIDQSGRPASIHEQKNGGGICKTCERFETRRFHKAHFHQLL